MLVLHLTSLFFFAVLRVKSGVTFAVTSPEVPFKRNTDTIVKPSADSIVEYAACANCTLPILRVIAIDSFVGFLSKQVPVSTHQGKSRGS
jgi:hypothetical protein